MPNFVLLTLIILIVIAICICNFYWLVVLPEKTLQRWAKKKSFAILSWDDEGVSDNPLLQGTGKWQHLFKVRVQTQDGNVRTGFVRLGSARAGLLSDYSEEFWDDAKPS